MNTAGSIYNPAKAPYKARWASLSNGARVLQFLDASGNVFQEIDGASQVVRKVKECYTHRQRCTIAEVNAGVTLLAAIPGWKYKLAFAAAISVGGAAGAVTTVDLLATASGSSRKLVTWAQANLTQSTYLGIGATGVTILADGASFTANDVNTALTAGKTGSSVTTATHIDFVIDYTLER